MIYQIKELIESEKNYKIYLSCSGAGAGLQNMLWSVSGISKILLGANFPYSTKEMDNYLGFAPKQYCSKSTACHMAMVSYQKALSLCGPNDTPVGLGLTAVVATNKEHRGDHRVHVAVLSKDTNLVVTCVVDKNVSNRKNDGLICDVIGLVALLNATTKKNLSYSYPGFDYNIETLSGKYQKIEIEQNPEKVFFDSFMEYPVHLKNGTKLSSYTDDAKTAYFPGSFNPPHEGHFGISNSYIEKTGGNVVFTISCDHPYKPHLKVQDMLERSQKLSGHDRIFTLNSPLFVDKVKQTPNRTFLMGADTFVRLLDPKWGVDTKEVVNTFINTNTKIYVANRDNIDIMSYVNEIHSRFYEYVYIIRGNWDISSTELRNKCMPKI